MILSGLRAQEQVPERAVVGRGSREGSGQAPAPPTPHRPSPGALVICGGGALPEPVWQRFIELAGGPKARIVVIPTASGDAGGPASVRGEFLEPWTRRGVGSAVLLHTGSRVKADEPGFARSLDEEIDRPGDFGFFRLIDAASSIEPGTEGGKPGGTPTLVVTWVLRTQKAWIKMDIRPPEAESAFSSYLDKHERVFRNYQCPRIVASGVR